MPVDLQIRDGKFTWNFEIPKGFVSEYAHSPIGFHDPSQVAGTPFFDDDRFIIKFNNFWTIEAPLGYFYLGRALVNRNQYEEALKAFEKAEKAGYAAPQVQLQRAGIYRAKNEIGHAKTILVKLEEQSGFSAEFHFQMAGVLLAE